MNADLVDFKTGRFSNLHYCPESGKFKWKIKPRGSKGDGSAGCFHTDKKGNIYVHINTQGKVRKAHRIAWEIFYNCAPPAEIDHIDGDGTNNKISNLRSSDSLKNKHNKSMQSNNSSGVTGVNLHSNEKGWICRIQFKGKSIYLGYFTDFEKAKSARFNAEFEYGFSKRHGKSKRTKITENSNA